MSYRVKKLFKILTFCALLIASWEGLYLLEIWPSWLFPSPLDVGQALVRGFTDRSFFVGALISMRRILVGFGISIVFGSILGVAIGKVRLLREVVSPLILGLQTVPSICWLPLALLWFGLNERAIIFVVVMGTILSMTISVMGALKQVPVSYIKAGWALGAKGFDLYRHVYIPAMIPAYVTGLKHGWSFAWRSLMSGEMLFITAGLGQLLMFGRELNDMSQVLAVMIIIIAIGVLFDRVIFGWMDRRIRARWGV